MAAKVLGDLLNANLLDGDTVETEDGERVRINHIDTSEVAKSFGPGTLGGDAAWQAAEDYASDPNAQIVATGGKDIHGRTLGDIVIEGREPLSEHLVRTGHAAPAYTNDQRTRDVQTIGNMLVPMEQDTEMANAFQANYYAEDPGDSTNLNRYWSPDGTLSKGIRRGLDQTQLGIAYLLDDEEAISKNLEELRRNQAEIGSIQNIGDVGDAFTWGLEVLGSQIPQLAVDAGFAAVGAATAGVGASGIVARRAGMSAMKQTLKKGMQEGLEQTALRQAALEAGQQAAANHFQKVAATGARWGGASGIYLQSVGESMSNLREDGGEYLESLATSLGISIPQAALEYTGLARSIGDLSRATGLSSDVVNRTIASRFGEMAKTMGVEGATESMQTVIDMAANLQLNGTPFDLDELMNAAAAGAFIGGVFSSAGHVVGGGYEAAKAKWQTALTNPTPTVAESETTNPSTPEPAQDIEAQFADMNNPNTSRDTVFVADGNVVPDWVDTTRTMSFEVDGGKVFADVGQVGQDRLAEFIQNPGKAQEYFESKFVDNKSAMSEQDLKDAQVVQRVDQAGAVVDEQLVKRENVEQAKERLAEEVQPGEAVKVETPEAVQERRLEKVSATDQTRPKVLGDLINERSETSRPESDVESSIQQRGGDRDVRTRAEERLGEGSDRGRPEESRASREAANAEIDGAPDVRASAAFFLNDGTEFNPEQSETGGIANDALAKQDDHGGLREDDRRTEHTDPLMERAIRDVKNIVSRPVYDSSKNQNRVAETLQTLQSAHPLFEWKPVKVGTPKGKQSQQYTFQPEYRSFESAEAAQQFVRDNLSKFKNSFYELSGGKLRSHPIPAFMQTGDTDTINPVMQAAFFKAQEKAKLDKTGNRSWAFNGTKLHLPSLTEVGRELLNDQKADDLKAFNEAIAQLYMAGYFPDKGLYVKNKIRGDRVISTRKEDINAATLQAKPKLQGKTLGEYLDYEPAEREAGIGADTELTEAERIREKDQYETGRFSEDKQTSKNQVRREALKVQKREVQTRKNKAKAENKESGKLKKTLAALEDMERSLDKAISDTYLTERGHENYQMVVRLPQLVSEMLGKKVDVHIEPGFLESRGEIRYNARGTNKHTIVLAHDLLNDSDPGNQRMPVYVAVHELAHIYTQKLLEDPQYQPRLQELWQSQNTSIREKYQKRGKQAETRYKTNASKAALNEWVTDQLALRLFTKTKQSKHKGVLAEIAFKVKAFYAKTMAGLRKLGIVRDASAQTLMTELMAKNYWADLDVYYERQSPRANADAFTLDPVVDGIKQAHAENPTLKRKMSALHAKFKQVWKSDSGRAFRFIFDYADNILRDIDPELASWFNKKIGTSGRKGYIQAKDGRTLEYHAEIDQLVGSMGKEEFERAATELQSKSKNLSANAQKLRQWYDNFYDSYAKPNMPTLGRVKDAYFTKVYEPSALIERPEDFEQILFEHFLKKNPKQEDYARQLAGETRQRIIDATGVFELEFDSPERAQGAKNIANLTRELDFSAEHEQRLIDGGYVFEDKEETMKYYVMQSVKRGEFERMFHTWEPVKGFPDPITGEDIITGTLTQIIANQPNIHRMFAERFGMNYAEARLGKKRLVSDDKLINFLVETGHLRREGGRIEQYHPGKKLSDKIEDIKARDPIQARDAMRILSAYQGRLGADMNPKLRKTQSWAIVVQSYLTLAFTAFASLPDFAGIVMRGRDLPGMVASAKGMMKAIREYPDKKELARMLGMLNERAALAAIQSRFGAETVDPKAAKALDTLFKYNGQEALTNFSRIMAVSAAETVLAQLGRRNDAEARRYLAELNLTAEEVNAWQAGTLDMRKAPKIRDAIRQFTDESILRPNATMRPVWASDPRFAIIWHLKSFVYAFGKVIMGGAIQEMRNSVDNGNLGNAALQPVIMAATFLPLAAVGLFLRGLIQYDMWEEDDENLDPYENMSGGAYLNELVKRAGMWGPFELAMQFSQQDEVDDAMIRLAGPTIDHLHTLFSADRSAADKFSRSVPLWSQLYGAQDRFLE